MKIIIAKDKIMESIREGKDVINKSDRTIDKNTAADDNGEFPIGAISSHDVSELVRQKREIEKKWLEMQTIFENMSDIIHVVDRSGRFIFSNKAAREYFSDITIKEPGDSYSFARHFDAKGNAIAAENSPIRRALRGEHVIAERTKIVYGDKTRYNNVSCTPIYMENGQIDYVVLSAREITQIVENENTIRKQQDQLLKIEIEKNTELQNKIESMKKINYLTELNTLKDKMLTVVTHDIRNPIATMVSLVELLNGEMKNCSGEIAEIVEAVREQVNNTYNMAETLLDWLKSQKEGLVYNPLVWDLSKIVREVIDLHYISALAKDICIVTDIAEGMNVYADKEILTLVLRNLISNSVKFTGKGGEISIQAFETEDEIIITVKDNGIGIDYEKAKTLFNRENALSSSGTAGEKGAGVGLLICREFVLRYGGRIWAESIPGKGSVFCFTLGKCIDKVRK